MIHQPISAESIHGADLVMFSWKIAGELPASPGQPSPLGFAGMVTGISNERLLVAGGANFPTAMPWEGGAKKYYTGIHVYRKVDGTLAPVALDAALPEPVAYTACCSTALGIVYAGGENDTGISNKTYLLRWEAAAGTIGITSLPDLPVAVTSAGLASVDHKVYLAGGHSASGTSAAFFCLNMANPAAGWQTLPPVPVPVSHMVLVTLPSANKPVLYVCGGRKTNPGTASILYDTVYAFDLKQNNWTLQPPLPYPLMAGAGIATGHSIILFGGDRGENFQRAEALTVAIENELDPQVKKALIQQKYKLQKEHTGFSKQVLEYNISTGKCVSNGSIPFAAPVTATAIRWNNDVYIPGGEVRAGIRTPYILTAGITGSTV